MAPWRVVLVNDGKSFSSQIQGMAMQCAPNVQLLQTKSPGMGQWEAFRLGLATLGQDHPFCIIHDDDRLKPDYVETLSIFAGHQTGRWICSHNLEVFSRPHDQRSLILPEETKAFVLRNQGETYLRYSHSFIPFPGTCFGISPHEVIRYLKPAYQEMADVVLLCECSRQTPIFFEPRPIYEYRRHADQVSQRMDYAMEDKLQQYLIQAGQGTVVTRRLGENLERRRAERFFSWAWDAGTFQGYPYRKQFHWGRVLRCVRNRKLKALRILLQDLFRSLRGGKI